MWVPIQAKTLVCSLLPGGSIFATLKEVSFEGFEVWKILCSRMQHIDDADPFLDLP